MTKTRELVKSRRQGYVGDVDSRLPKAEGQRKVQRVNGEKRKDRKVSASLRINNMLTANHVDVSWPRVCVLGCILSPIDLQIYRCVCDS